MSTRRCPSCGRRSRRTTGRPAAYQVSVVLIEAHQARRAAAAGADARTARPGHAAATAASSSTPTCCRRCRRCSTVEPPAHAAAARLGEPVDVPAHRLAGTARRRLRAPPARGADRDRADGGRRRRRGGRLSRCPTTPPAQSALAGRPAGAGVRVHAAGEPAPRETNAIRWRWRRPVIAADAGSACRRQRAAAACRRGSTVTLARARRCAPSSAPRCCSTSRHALRRAARHAIRSSFEFPDSVAGRHALGAAARRRRRQRADRPQRPGARASTRRSIRCRHERADGTQRPTRPSPTWAELNRQWLVAAHRAGSQRLDGSRRGREAAPATRTLARDAAVPRPRSTSCARAFGLSPFERELLLLVAGARARRGLRAARRGRHPDAPATADLRPGARGAAATALGCALARAPLRHWRMSSSSPAATWSQRRSASTSACCTTSPGSAASTSAWPAWPPGRGERRPSATPIRRSRARLAAAIGGDERRGPIVVLDGGEPAGRATRRCARHGARCRAALLWLARARPAAPSPRALALLARMSTARRVLTRRLLVAVRRQRRAASAARGLVARLRSAVHLARRRRSRLSALPRRPRAALRRAAA